MTEEDEQAPEPERVRRPDWVRLDRRDLAALLAVVDAARGPARFITALRDALESFTPAPVDARDDRVHPWGRGIEPIGRAFNERMQETERARRLAALGIELVDPAVSDAVSSGAGGRPVSHLGAEDGPQSLSRPASLDRDTPLWRACRRLAEAEARLEQAEARLSRVPALVEALRWALGGWHVFDVEQNHERYHATYALVDEWEQA